MGFEAERSRRSWCSQGTESEHGQIAIVAAVVIALAAAAVVGLAIIGRATIDRRYVAIAADTTALAAVQDTAAGAHIGAWYRGQGIDVEIESLAGTVSVSGVLARDVGDAATARSFAEVRPGPVPLSPALVAVLARADQLLGTQLDVTHPSPTTAWVSGLSGRTIVELRESLGLCVLEASGQAVLVALCATVQ